MDARSRKNFRREVQAIFQDPYEAYNPVYKVDQTLTTPVRKFGLAKTQEEARQKIEESLRLAGLRPEDTLGRYPHQLSGGQRQRIMVARACCFILASSWQMSPCPWSTLRYERPFSRVWSS